MEKWDLVDENRKPINKIINRGDKIEKGEYMIVVETWTVNSKNEILVTLRSPEKNAYPNYWENSGGAAISRRE